MPPYHKPFLSSLFPLAAPDDGQHFAIDDVLILVCIDTYQDERRTHSTSVSSKQPEREELLEIEQDRMRSRIPTHYFDPTQIILIWFLSWF